MAIVSKSKKLFLLVLLVLTSFVLSAVKFISGNGKTSKAQAQCWTPGTTGTTGTTNGTTGTTGTTAPTTAPTTSSCTDASSTCESCSPGTTSP